MPGRPRPTATAPTAQARWSRSPVLPNATSRAAVAAGSANRGSATSRGSMAVHSRSTSSACGRSATVSRGVCFGTVDRGDLERERRAEPWGQQQRQALDGLLANAGHERQHAVAGEQRGEQRGDRRLVFGLAAAPSAGPRSWLRPEASAWESAARRTVRDGDPAASGGSAANASLPIAANSSSLSATTSYTSDARPAESRSAFVK